MKVFIDLGAYIGDTLEDAMSLFPDVERFYAFEPYKDSFDILKSKFSIDKVYLYNAACGISDGYAGLFFKKGGGEGHSLCSDKNNVSSKSISVPCVDFSKFILDNFEVSDEIILKVNIEGAEYDVFEKMIEDGSIKYIKKIFCEWHFFKIPSVLRKHYRVLKKLQDIGFNLTGNNSEDAFVTYVSNNSIKDK